MVPAAVRKQAQFLAISFGGFAAMETWEALVWLSISTARGLILLFFACAILWVAMALRCVSEARTNKEFNRSRSVRTFGLSMGLSFLNVGWSLFWMLADAVGMNMNGYTSATHSWWVLAIPLGGLAMAVWSIVTLFAAWNGFRWSRKPA